MYFGHQDETCLKKQRLLGAPLSATTANQRNY